MPYTPKSSQGINRGLKRYKNRCFDQPRRTSDGIGGEWFINYFRDETIAREDEPNTSSIVESDKHMEYPEFHRTGKNLWSNARRAEGSSHVTAFEETAIRDNSWHRRRNEGCIGDPNYVLEYQDD